MNKDFLDRLKEVYWAGSGKTYSYPIKSAEINGDVLHIVVMRQRKEEHLYGHKDSTCVTGSRGFIYYLSEHEAEYVAKRKDILDSVYEFKDSLSKLQDLLL